jgi:hypothetical protein
MIIYNVMLIDAENPNREHFIASFFDKQEAFMFAGSQRNPGNYVVKENKPNGNPQVFAVLDKEGGELLEVFSTNRAAKDYRREHAAYEDCQKSDFLVVVRHVDIMAGAKLSPYWGVEVRTDGAEESAPVEGFQLRLPGIDSVIHNEYESSILVDSFLSLDHANEIAARVRDEHNQPLQAYTA